SVQAPCYRRRVRRPVLATHGSSIGVFHWQHLGLRLGFGAPPGRPCLESFPDLLDGPSSPRCNRGTAGPGTFTLFWRLSSLRWLRPHRGFAFTRTIVTLRDRKSTRLNSSHGSISYAVFCLKKKKT